MFAKPVFNIILLLTVCFIRALFKFQKNQENEESYHDSRCRKSGLRKKTDEPEFSSGDHSAEHALLQMTVKSAGVLLHLAGYQNVSPYSDTTWILNNN